MPLGCPREPPRTSLPMAVKKNKCSGHNIFMMNCPPSAPELKFITFTYGTNWNDNFSFSLTLLSILVYWKKKITYVVKLNSNFNSTTTST